MVKLILTDIDETIMPKGMSQVPRHVIDAFHAAQDAGIVVGVATGRGLSWVPSFFGDGERCCSTALATNGSQILLDGEVIYEANLDHAGLEQVRAIVRDVPTAGMLVFDGGTPLLVEGERDDLAQVFPSYATVCVPVDAIPSAPVVKANIFVLRDEAGTRDLVARLNDEVDAFDFDYPRPGFSNVMPHGWNKGAGVLRLCERLGIGPEDAVVFGDSGNDLSMFSVVPNSVCVANGTEEARAAARWHIGSCDDGAVSKAIQALAGGEWPFAE